MYTYTGSYKDIIQNTNSYTIYYNADPVIARVHNGLGYMPEAGAVSDGDSVMPAIDQSALISCHEASSLETSVTSLYQECQPALPKPR